MVGFSHNTGVFHSLLVIPAKAGMTSKKLARFAHKSQTKKAPEA